MNNNLPALIKFCYHSSLTYLQEILTSKTLNHNSLICPKSLAEELTVSLLVKRQKELHEFQNLTNKAKPNKIDFIEYKYSLLQDIRNRAEQAIEFEMLKYDLITIEEYLDK